MVKATLIVLAALALVSFDSISCVQQDASSKADIIQYAPSLEQFRNLEKPNEPTPVEEPPAKPCSSLTSDAAQAKQEQPITKSCWCDETKRQEYEAAQEALKVEKSPKAGAQKSTKESKKSRKYKVITVDLPDGSLDIAGTVLEVEAAQQASAQGADSSPTPSATLEPTANNQEAKVSTSVIEQTEKPQVEKATNDKIESRSGVENKDEEQETKEAIEEPKEAKQSKKNKGKKANKDEKKRSKRNTKGSSKRESKSKDKRSASSKDSNKKGKKNKNKK